MATAIQRVHSYSPLVASFAPTTKSRWAIRSVPSVQTVAVEDLVKTGSTFLVISDIDCGNAHRNVELGTLAIDRFRHAHAHTDRELSLTSAIEHALSHAMLATRLEAHQRTGHRLIAEGAAISEFDGVSLMAIVAEGAQLTAIHVGSCQLWIMRSERLFPLIVEPSVGIKTSVRNLHAGDRVLVFSALVADAFSPAELEHLLLTEPSDTMVAATLIERATLPGSAAIISAACMTQPARADALPALKPLQRMLAPPKSRAVALRPPAVLQTPKLPPTRAVSAKSLVPPGAVPAKRPRQARLPGAFQPQLILIGLLAVSMVVLCAVLLALAIPSLMNISTEGKNTSLDSVGASQIETQIVLPPTLTPLPSAATPVVAQVGLEKSPEQPTRANPDPPLTLSTPAPTGPAERTLRSVGDIASKAERNTPKLATASATPYPYVPSRGIPSTP